LHGCTTRAPLQIPFWEIALKLHLFALSFALTLSASATAFANTIDLTFEGLASPANPEVLIGNYYNGGAGPNYGITFSPNAGALCYNTASQTCSNTSRGGLGDPNSQGGGLDFLNGSSAYLNDAAGFTTGFSLFYSAPYFGGSVGVYSGLNGTGTLLTTLTLGTTPIGACDTTFSRGAGYCPFVPVGSTFAGTAQSILFSGTPNYIEFDDVTFGSATPGPPSTVTPEPSSFVLFFTGAAALAPGIRRRLTRAA
jgi:hypothetical protein